MSSTAILALVNIILTEAPYAVEAVRALLAKKDPTPEDFAAARAQIQKDTFEALAPDAAKLIAEDDAKQC